MSIKKKTIQVNKMQKHSRLSEYFIGWILFFSALTMNRFPYLCHLYRYQNPSSCALGSHSHIGSRNRHKRRPLRHSTPNLSIRAEISFRNSRAIIQDVLACNLYNVISHGTRSPPPNKKALLCTSHWPDENP